jgi:gliding motility-associated-like protein
MSVSKLLLSISVTVLCFQFGFSQNEPNIWYFGENAGLDFNGGDPVPLLNGALDTNEGCASISNSNGEILFYTDGITVYNRNHVVMANGNGLNGDPSSTNSAIIVPKPDSSTIYYVFTVDKRAEEDGLQYSEVDMSLDSGLGAVTSVKNILLETPTAEKITSVQKEDNSGYWVVSHKWNSDEFITYDVTNAGVNPIPITSAVGTFINGQTTQTIGAIKISPDGTRLAVARGEGLSEVQLFDFDSTTGIVSNALTVMDLPNNQFVYGIEFSPNSKRLYSSVYLQGVFQFNLDLATESDIINSMTQVVPNVSIGYSALQLGPNGKIYVAREISPSLDVIKNPDEIGVLCNYVINGQPLGGRRVEQGFPSFVQSFFNVGFSFSNVCFGEEVSFLINQLQPYDTLSWDFGDGTISNDPNPSHTYQSPGEYMVTLEVTLNGDTSIETQTVQVYEVPVVNPIVQIEQCDDDVDGFSLFNLTEVIDEITANNATEIITFHESENEAILDISPIGTPTQYQNQTVNQDTVWARVENNNGCFKTSQVDLEVSTTQIPINFTRSFYECDDAINGTTTDGISSFDFSTVTQEIIAVFPAGQQLIISYYRTVTDALSEENAILNISDYRNETSPFTENIYIRVDSAVNNDCLGLGEHITLNVETVPEAYDIVIDTLCDEDGDGLASFDTSQIESELLQGQNNIVVTYTDQNGAALPSPLPNPFVTGSLNVIATLTNSISQDNDGACADHTTLSFQVEAVAIANTVAVQRNCDDNDDGVFGFDTSTIENTVLNGQTGMTVSYTEENGDILPSPLPNPFITATQDITVRVENQLSSDCYDETIISFIVDQQPQAFAIMDDFVCDDVSNNGEATFILSLYNSEILGSQSSGVFEVLYFASAESAQDGIGELLNTFINTSNPQTIHARIQNSQNPNCFDITTFQIGIYELPIANQIDDVDICDIDNDTFEFFDLSSLNGSIINGQSDTSITYHSSASDANLSQNELDTMVELNESTTQVFARLESSLSSDCYTTTPFTINLREQPEIELDSVYFICDENPIMLSVNGSYDLYEWSTGEFSTDITISEPGNYSVSATNFYGDFECSETFQFQVLASGFPEILDVVVQDFTNSDNSISITVAGTGDYEFSLDFENWQDEGLFSNLEYQESYNVFIQDKNGCGFIVQEVFLLNAPTYFTPNGDGINDLWNVYNFDKETSGVVHIFDRYGKQLTSINAGTIGWNGIYNGQELPSTDYWFRLEKESGEVRMGHFSLLR